MANNQREAVLKALSADEWMDRDTLREEAGIRNDELIASLRSLEDSGRIEKEGSGRKGNKFMYRMRFDSLIPYMGGNFGIELSEAQENRWLM